MEIDNINEVYINFIKGFKNEPSRTPWMDGYNCAIEDIIRALENEITAKGKV